MAGVKLQSEIDGNVIGYRVWGIGAQGLTSVRKWTGNYVWRPGPQKAVCYRVRPPSQPYAHEAPERWCHCGFNAHHDLNAALCRQNGVAGTTIVGAISAWGEMEVHQGGFRSEWAEPVALCIGPGPLGMPGRPRLVQQVAKSFGIPLLPPENMDTVVKEHGSFIPEELRPKSSVNEVQSRISGQVDKLAKQLMELSQTAQQTAQRLNIDLLQ